jgi:hypothetical protein
MANQTLTDVTRNYDDAAINGLLNGEDVTLNNSTLIINSDVRWGQQAAVLGNLTISATLGGLCRLDGRDVWWMPYDGGTGNVPALGTAGTNDVTGSTAGAGEFLGVFTALGTAPVAAAAAMPATGFIKFRRVTAAFVDNEVMTFTGGATATVNSATGGQRGWIHFVGEEASTATIPRLGRFEALGDWFELGTTNGADDQTFQYPVLDACPAIQIETAAGSGVYEWFLNAGSRWGTATQYVPTDARGKYFGMVNATGVITIARRASNSCGFKPVTGCRVRIPNILISNSNTTNFALNTISGTLATRWDFTTTSAGAIDIRNTCGNWYMSFSSPFSVNVQDSATLHQILVANTADVTTLSNVAVGLDLAVAAIALSYSNLFTGGTITGSRFARYSLNGSGDAAVTFTDVVDLDCTDTIFEGFGATAAITRGNGTVYAILATRMNDSSFTNCSLIGSRIELTQCARIVLTGTRYADQTNGTTVTTNAQSAISISNASTNIDISGFSNFQAIANVHPYNGILNAANSFFINMNTIGTAAAPYNCGSGNATGLIANATVCTDLTFRRIYTDNLRTSPFTFTNTVQRVTCVNVWGDGADSQALAALSIMPQGCRWTNSVTGQTSVYGRHWEDAFTAATTGRILIAMNEALADTASQVSITAGTPAFTSAGQIAMRTLGDQVVWTMPYYCLGYTSLANIAPTITGTNTGNFSFEFQIDTGSGFGSWLALTGANLNAQSISPSAGFKLKVRATVTVANSTNALTYIRIDGVTNSTDQRTQYPLPFTAQGSITGIISGSRIQIYNVTTAAEILNQIVSGTSLTYDYYNGTGISSGDVLRIRLAYVSGVTARLPQEIIAVASATGFAALASQALDEVYNTNAVDGSTVSELTADYPNIQIDSNDVDGETNVQRLYAWFAYNQFTSSGIEEFFNAVLAEDLVNYRIRTAVANLKLDNVIATPLMIIGGRIYRDDGATVIAAASNSIQLDPDKAYGVEVGTSGLTAGEAATLAILDTLTEDVSGLRFTTKALEQAPAGGGGGSADWTAGEKEQIRHRLGIDGTATAPTASPSLARPSDIPTASQNATQVRTELTTELGRIDATVSSRLATAGYTAPPSASAIRTEIDTNSTKLDVAVGTRLSTAGYTAPPTASANASAVRTELSTELGRIDVAVSTRNATAPDNASVAAIKAKTDNLPADPASNTQVNTRLSSASYVAPANSDIAAIKAKTDSLPTDPADNSEILAAVAGVTAPSAATVAAAVRTELTTELGRIDVATSTRLAAGSYVAPANSDIAAIKTKTDNLPTDPADQSAVEAAIAAIPAAPSASSVASAVRTELSTELGRVDAAVSTRATPAQVKTQSDQALVDYDPATGAEVAAVKKNTDLIPAAL